MAVVQQQGVVGLAQGTHFAMLVDVVALLHVLQYLVKVYGLSFGLQLVVAALGAYLGRGGDEYLQLGVGEDGGAYVAAIHHDAFLSSHFLLLLDHGFAYEVEGSHRTDMGGYFHGAYLAFYVHAVQVSVGTVGFRVGAESDVEVVYFVPKFFHVDLSVVQESVFDAVQGDGTIHGSAVDVDIADLAGQVFGHGAFSAGGKSVNGDSYLSHFSYI